jgi:hypothetical protein
MGRVQKFMQSGLSQKVKNVPAARNTTATNQFEQFCHQSSLA